MSKANLLERRSVVSALLEGRKDAIVVGGLGASTYDIPLERRVTNNPPAPATTDAAGITSDVPSPQTESSPYRSRGPHIANVRMMKAEEAKEFNDSLKPGNAQKP